MIIRSDAFSECASLKELQLPSKIHTLGDRAFYRCKSLESVHFPENLKQIRSYAFYLCGLSALNLPDSLEFIGEGAFFKCKNLLSVTLPTSVRRIEKWAFRGCNRLACLEISHDPDFIGEEIINHSTVIRCRKGSSADLYCQKYGFLTEYL